MPIFYIYSIITIFGTGYIIKKAFNRFTLKRHNLKPVKFWVSDKWRYLSEPVVTPDNEIPANETRMITRVIKHPSIR